MKRSELKQSERAQWQVKDSTYALAVVLSLLGCIQRAESKDKKHPSLSVFKFYSCCCCFFFFNTLIAQLMNCLIINCFTLVVLLFIKIKSSRLIGNFSGAIGLKS